MYLKSLVLKGFKSFADRSVLRLEPGLTVVVGPNGSGKSNISDAVLWVLGEQSAKQLRGTSMEDVIFAGSSARKAVSLAEVDLVLDNSDGTLPLDFNEVVITRRMYRSGESEYLINNSPSRLTDVLDILNDSGLGRDAHSIISQGTLQNALRGRPEDRRILIEEAAGILKHRKRKEKSERKLKNLDAELVRVKDLAGELDRQLKPLERQAKKARQHEQLDGELREIELTLAVDDLRILQASWEDAERREKEADAAVELARLQANERDEELNKYQRLLEEKGLFVGDINEQRRRSQLALQRLDAGMLLLEEKGRNMVTRLSELRQTIHRSDARVKEASSQLEEAKDQQRETTARRTELESQLSTLQTESGDLHLQRKSADAEMGKMSSLVRSKARAIDDCKLKSVKAQERLSGADVEDGLLADRAKQIDERLVATRSSLDEQKGHLADLSEKVENLQAEADAARQSINTATTHRDSARKAVDDARSALQSLNTELKGLQQIDRAFDETNPLHAWVLDHKDELAGIVSPLSELFAAPPEVEPLVEHLLGADIYGVTMTDSAAASKLAAMVKDRESNLAGILSLMPLVGNQVARAGSSTGQRLLDLLEYDAANEHVAQALLGDVYLVDSIDKALEAAEHEHAHVRYVTPDLAVVWPNGKIVLGAQATNSEGVLARKRRISDVRASIPACEKKSADAKTELEQADEMLAAAQAAGVETSQHLASAKGEMNAVRQDIGRLEQTLSTLSRERAAVDDRRKGIQENCAAARAQVQELEELHQTLKKEHDEAEEKLARIRDHRSQLIEREGTYTESLSSIRVELATVRERESHLNRQIQSLSSELEKLATSLAVSRQTEESLEILRLRVEPLYGQLTELREHICRTGDVLADRAQLEEAGQGDLRRAIEDARSVVVESKKKLDQATETLSKVRIEKGKLEVQVDTAVKTISEKGVLLDVALELPAPENREETEAQAEKLRNKINRLGAVNPVAMEEYRALKDRRDFIGLQLEDLESASKSLKRIVAAIDRKMRNQFIETFEKVNSNFVETFGLLFPGGHGSLELTDPDSPETTGVEIHAQPRGKAVRKQSLLSGGEQSLVALALLFSVYRVRKTPFFIMDEVEAALDDTNLRRLLTYLDTVRRHTQLIMVSHQRRTMEMADLLYGVSMRSDGVSKLVSQRLEQAIRLDRSEGSASLDIEGFSNAE